ncbi:MAG: hypothetical protein HQ580_19265 [Planctomycetes bacterium]|nr:hypothetical protein [Planctomycetota bacterium]
MKKYFIAIFLALFLLMGCATTNTNPLEGISKKLTPVVETLSSDWPKASGLIRGAIGTDNLPKSVVDQLDEIDSWWKDGDEWKTAEEIQLSTYQKWYIAGVRVGHTGPVLRAMIMQYAPGLLSFSEVGTALAFLGLAL